MSFPIRDARRSNAAGSLEPLEGVDAGGRRECAAIAFDLRQEGRVLVSLLGRLRFAGAGDRSLAAVQPIHDVDHFAIVDPHGRAGDAEHLGLDVDIKRPAHSLAFARRLADRSFMDALCSGNTDFCDQWSEDEFTEQAGRGGHEVRTWVAGFSALRTCGGYAAEVAFYEPIKEWITGTAVVTATPSGSV